MSLGACVLWVSHKDSLIPSPTDTSPAVTETTDSSSPVYQMVMGTEGHIPMEEGTALETMEGPLGATEGLLGGMEEAWTWTYVSPFSGSELFCLIKIKQKMQCLHIINCAISLFLNFYSFFVSTMFSKAPFLWMNPLMFANILPTCV